MDESRRSGIRYRNEFKSPSGAKCEGSSFPTVFTEEEAGKMLRKVENRLGGQYLPGLGTLEMVRLKELQPLERQVLVEKHLISPLLAKEFEMGGVLITENEEVSIMVNEEDHIRIQCLFPGPAEGGIGCGKPYRRFARK